MNVSDCRIGISVVYRGIVSRDIEGFIISEPEEHLFHLLNGHISVIIQVRIMTTDGVLISINIKRLEKLLQ